MQPLAPVIDSLLQGLKAGVKGKRATLQSIWPQIVGSSLSPHTKPSLMREGILCVWVDSSVLAYELSQRYRGTILKRTQASLGEETVKKIIFRVGEIRLN